VVSPLRGQIALSHRDDFRIVHFNIEDNHLHLIVECSDSSTLGERIGELSSRLARRINRLFKRSGDVFDDRYHSRVLRTPRETRNAIRYVLNNYRHHAEERGKQLPADWIDPFSSAAWFDGWARPIVMNEEWKRMLAALPAPTLPARTWLLKTGWRRRGLIEFDEVPGASPNHRPKKRRVR
jgi:REP element-mobilizing transposase RayT